MIDQIKVNEERLDKITDSIIDLDRALTKFRECKKDIKLLSKYYGSREWLLAHDKINEGKITGIKAGVLSEDAVWNTLEDINALLDKMKKIIKVMKK